MRAALAGLLLLYGCAAKGPQTPEALRQSVTSSKAHTFSSRRAELHVMRERSGDVQYVLVADALPLRRDRTSVQLYASNGYDALVAAVKSWANGRDAACPDMSRGP
ncbi:MAG: hypothetical protein ACT4P3_20445 [Betaproteobacteria bacterium]